MKIRVLTWNILDPELIDNFVKVPDKIIDWDFRGPLLHSIIYNKLHPLDIMCLQEVPNEPILSYDVNILY